MNDQIKDNVPAWNKGFHPGFIPSGWDAAEYSQYRLKYCKPEMRPYCDPLRPPFAVGDVVGKGTRAFDLGMKYTIIGLRYSHCIWRATLSIGSGWHEEIVGTYAAHRLRLVAAREPKAEAAE